MKTTRPLDSLQRFRRPRPLVWALALAGVATHVLGVGGAHAAGALPTGLNVVQGQASVVQAGNAMTVTNSAGAVLNWQSFNIGAQNLVRFEQPNAQSRVLNRVVGNNASQIFGQLTSNGEVWLINPNGVLFGRDARIDVKGLVASTLNIGNDDWRAGRYSLTGGAENTAAIVNQGELRTVTGGRVFLVAGAGGVRNEGLIAAPDGQVSLAAGATVDLVDAQSSRVAVRVQAPQGEALNLGSIAVGGGRVDLAAAMVNQQGFVRAESLSGNGGHIVLSGSEGVNLTAGSVTSAAGASGGSVQVDGGSGTTLLTGEVNVSGSAGAGGDALLLGHQVGLLDGSRIDASGSGGGGRVRIGGGLQGRDSSVTNSNAVYMGKGAQITADATGNGTGGTVILWGNEATRAYGTISARGGAQGGDGGFIETSGGWLDAQPALIRTDAVAGKAGVWLLDPNNLTISDQVQDIRITGNPNFTTTGNGSTLSTATINLALNTGNVVITTANVSSPGDNGPEPGDISLSSANIISNNAARHSLTINATRNLTMTDSRITSNAAPLDVTLSAGNGNTGTGSISLSNSRILSNGGNINLGGPTRAVGPNIPSPRAGAVGAGSGVSIFISTLDARVPNAPNAPAGDVTIVGQSTGGGGRGGYGVEIYGLPDDGDGGFRPTSIFGRDIDIFGWVDSNAVEQRRGVRIGAATTITATHGLTVTGVANSAVYAAPAPAPTPAPTPAPAPAPLAQVQPIGVSVEEDAALLVLPTAADPTAFLTIDGTVRDGAPTNGVDTNRLRVGVQVDAGAGIAATNGAKVTIAGHDLLNAFAGSAAVFLGNGSTFEFSLAGDVTIQGDTRVYLDGQFNAPTNHIFAATAGDVLRMFSGTISGDPTQVTLNGRDIRLAGGTLIDVGRQTVVPEVTLNATRDITIDFSDIRAGTGPINIVLNAAAGNSGSGTVDLVGAFLYSGGGDITIGGGSAAVGPNLTAPRTGAVSTSASNRDAGVAIRESGINADGGNIRISGQSVADNEGFSYGVLVTGGEGGSFIYGRNVDIFGWVDSNGATERTGVRIDRFSQVLAENSLSITGLANSGVFRLGRQVAPIGVHITESSVVGLAPPFQGGGGGVRPTGRQQGLGVVVQEPPAALTITGTTNDAAITDPETAARRYGVLIEDDAVISTNYELERPAPQAAATGRVVIAEPPPFERPVVTITGTDQSPNDDISVRIDTRFSDFTSAESLTITGNHQIQLAGRMVAPAVGTMDVRAGTTLSLQQWLLEGVPNSVSLRGDVRLSATGDVNFEFPTQLTLQGAEVRLGDNGNFNAITGGRIRVFTDRLVTNQPTLLSSFAPGAGTAITIAGYDQLSGITSMQSTTAPPTLEVEEGRWLIYARDDSIPTAGLDYAFRQYNMTYPAEPVPLPNGNGLVFQQAPVLTLSSAATITRSYDGTTVVSTTGINPTLTGFRPGQQANGPLGNITFSYASPNVASNQLLTVNGLTLPPIVEPVGEGSIPVFGYTIQSSVRGSITPRSLAYIADPVTLNASQLSSTTLTGRVTGFIEGENLANATTGTLRFTTPATSQSAPGSYAIEGSGLAATNYTFFQGEGNGDALTLVAPPPPAVVPVQPQVEGIPEMQDSTRLYRQSLPPLPRGPEGVRALDALQSLRVDPTWLSMAFGELDLSSMSREEIAALLEARRQYKMQILAVGRERLTQDPSLADVPACQTAKQSETGRCLVSAELLAAIDARGENASIEAPGPGPAVPTVAAVAAAQPPRPTAPAVPAVPAPAGAPAAAAPAPAPAAAAPAPAPLAPAAAAVVAAATLPPVLSPVPNLPAAAAPTAAPLPTSTVGTTMPPPRPVEPRVPPRVRQAAQPVLQPPPIPNARAVQQASLPQIQRKIAVLVGIDNYVDERIPALENARRDVDAVARVLEQRLGYETLIVRDAGREAVVGLLNRLALQVRPQDSVVVYYAGHGTVVDGTNQGYWIPATADAERPETWISNRDIGRLLGSLRAQQVVLISDSCFSGSLVGDKRIQAGSTTDARLMLQRRATVVMSSGGDEPVADGATGGHSPFSSSLMATLQGLDNWRVGGNVFDKVRDDVTKRLPQTPRYGPARDARHAEGADYLFEQRQLGR